VAKSFVTLVKIEVSLDITLSVSAVHVDLVVEGRRRCPVRILVDLVGGGHSHVPRESRGRRDGKYRTT
jgi:hypothetical protein